MGTRLFIQYCTVRKRRRRWYEDSQSYADINLTMAEAALYGFKNDPRFPYEAIAEHLTWIPKYINELTPLHNPRCHVMYHCLINILLVFSRARTSTLIYVDDKCHPPPSELYPVFVQRLNVILGLLPNGAGKWHKLEIFRYNRTDWFVTSTYSPRFIWCYQLTHRQVGLNLDFFAAGHVGCDWSNYTSIIETSGIYNVGIVDETIHSDFALNVEEHTSFSQRKEKLYNSTMINLQLPYRFKWFPHNPHVIEVFDQAMQSSLPPSLSWWHSNFPHLNWRGYYTYTAWCSSDTRHDAFWSFIQEVYNWSSEQKRRYPKWGNLPRHYSKKLECLCVQIRAALEREEFANGTLTQFRGLMADVDRTTQQIQTTPSAMKYWPSSSIKLESWAVHAWHSLVTVIKLYSVHAFKRGTRREFGALKEWPPEGDEVYIKWRWKWF